MIENVVRDIILENNYLRGIVDNRVHLIRLPVNFVLPAMVISREGGIGGIETFDWDEARINITIYGKEIKDVNNMYEKRVNEKWFGINLLLHKKGNYVKIKDGVKVVIYWGIRTGGPFIKFEPEILVYSMDTFYTFRYRLYGWENE